MFTNSRSIQSKIEILSYEHKNLRCLFISQLQGKVCVRALILETPTERQVGVRTCALSQKMGYSVLVPIVPNNHQPSLSGGYFCLILNYTQVGCIC